MKVLRNKHNRVGTKGVKTHVMELSAVKPSTTKSGKKVSAEARLDGRQKSSQ